MSLTHAIVRRPAPTFAAGITTSALGRPDYEIMQQQHAAYVELLRELGVDVAVLDPLPEFPDAHFVEDVAVILPEVAIVTNPGAPARTGEAATIEASLGEHRVLERIMAPGTMDGGDVLRVGKHYFVGISERTNDAGAKQFGEIAFRHGFRWTAVPVGAGLHLKSSVNRIADDTILVTERLATRDEFRKLRRVVLDEAEEYAANALSVNGKVLIAKGFPRTRDRIVDLGLDVRELEMSESEKMDGGLTCLSLRLGPRG